MSEKLVKNFVFNNFASFVILNFIRSLFEFISLVTKGAHEREIFLFLNLFNAERKWSKEVFFCVEPPKPRSRK